MADTFGHGLIIWSSVDKNESLIRLEANVFEPVDSAINFTSGSSSSEFPNGGIVGMSLTPAIFLDEPRYLYFRPLSSLDLWAADTRVLTTIHNGHRAKFHGLKNIFSSQVSSQVFSSEGTMFLGLTKENAIACYNHYRPLEKENVVS